MAENEKLIKSYEEAIDCLKKNKPTSGFYMLQESVDMAVNALEEIEQYRAIGTVEECWALVEKQHAKKPVTYLEASRADCPICGNTVRGIKEPFGTYCCGCGQKLDWSDEE